MSLEKLDKAIGKGLSMIQEKLSDSKKRITTISSDIKDTSKKTEEKLKNIDDKVSKIPTEYPEYNDYTKKLEEIKNKINNGEVVSAITDLKKVIENKKDIEINDIDVSNIEEILKEIRDKTQSDILFPEIQTIKLTKEQLKILTPYAHKNVDAHIVNVNGENLNPSTSEGQSTANDLLTQITSNTTDIIANQLSQLMVRIATNSGDDSICYVGRAPIGSATSSAVWQIVRYSDADSEVSKFANGGAYDQVFDDRESLSFS